MMTVEPVKILPQVAGYPQNGSVELSWGWVRWGSNQSDEATRPDAFRILMGEAGKGSLREFAMVNGDQSRYQVQGLTNRHTYTFAVEALVNNQLAVRSNLIAVAPDQQISAQPVFDAAPTNRYWGSWSPEGKSIVYVAEHPEESEGVAIFTYRLDNREKTFHSGGTQPHWHRQSQRILFVTDLILNRASPEALPTYLGLLEQGQLTLYMGGNGSYLQPTWSPDGRRIAFLANLGQGHFDLYQSIFSSSPEPLPLTQGFTDLTELKAPLDRSPQHPTWSPDGQWIAYDRFAPKADHAAMYAKDIFQTSVRGTEGEVPLVQSDWEDQNPAFSPDGKQLAYLSDRSGVNGIWMLDLLSGHSRQLYGGRNPAVDVQRSRLAWSPAGDRLLFNGWVNDSVSSLFTLQVEP